MVQIILARQSVRCFVATIGVADEAETGAVETGVVETEAMEEGVIARS